MIHIDGSQGEGGGQILRTSLALSLITGRPFVIENIRANRSKPGLAKQHLTAVQAAARVGHAQVDGADLRSQRLVFHPGKVEAGSFHFPIGTAGSTTLVLQTVLPPLLMAGGTSRVRIEGGTHNVHAPPYDFVEKTFLPVVSRMGPRLDARLERRGFYPAGGGAFEVRVDPTPLRRLDLGPRGGLEDVRARVVLANLPRHIAERELAVVAEALDLRPHQLEIDEGFLGKAPGNALHIELRSAQLTELVTGFGERGVPAEKVAAGAVAEARQYLHTSASVGEHLADQLLIPMALAGGGSMITVAPSLHTRTNIDVIRLFLDVEISVTTSGDAWRIEVGKQP